MARRSEKRHDVWTVADAKARLSEVIERANGEPQVITRNAKAPPGGIPAQLPPARRRARPRAAARRAARSLDFEVPARYQCPLRSAAARARSAGSRMARPARRGPRLHQRGDAGGDPPRRSSDANRAPPRRTRPLARRRPRRSLRRPNPARRPKDRFRLGRSDGGGQTTGTASPRWTASWPRPRSPMV